MSIHVNVERHKVIAVTTTAIAYVCWLFLYMLYEDSAEVSSSTITIVSVFGTLLVIVYVMIWWKMVGRLFTPLNIFLAFFVVFNFGQCLLWSVGIHSDSEIGQKLVFSRLDAQNITILQAQLLFIMCFITLNCGAMLVWNRSQSLQLTPICNENTAHDMRYRCLFYTALVLSIIVIPVVLYNTFYIFQLSMRYGYSSLYNGEARNMLMGTGVNILSQLFFPCLLGLLIGSRYNKWVRLVVYVIFLIYAVIRLLCGDRGEWINLFIFLFFADYYFYKKRSGKVLFVFLFVGIFALALVNAIVSMRNVGLSWEGFVSVLIDTDSNPIISMLLEFGQSMGISMLLIAYNVTFPYGNSYIMSVPTLFSTGVFNGIFGTNYVQVHTWFPQYLGINYGTDFSMIGEAILNFGVYVAPLVVLLEGVIIGKIAVLPYRKNVGPLGLCLSLSVMAYVLKIARSTVWLVANNVCYSIGIFSLVYYVVTQLLTVKTEKKC